MATTPTTITQLDFDDIKQSLKDFFSTQSEFTDYDFEGSGLSQLLNNLSLNTHYNAYMANAIFNEAFLDSAIKRGNVVSRAKEIGYTSRSAKSATAVVNIDVLNPTYTPVSLVLDRYTPFTSNIGGTSFTFYNIEAVSTPMSNGSYSFSNVKLYEGTLITNTFVYNGGDSLFEIPNAAIDTSTLTVKVQRSATDSYVENYTFTEDIVGVTGASKVFFIQENAKELYEVYFGDGAIGAALVPGNIVTLTYLVSSLDAANVSSSKFVQTFSYNGGIGGNANIVISTVSNSVGGQDKEDITSIKFNAPLSLARANRTITTNDYLSAITDAASAVESVSVWGGEDNNPPVYGKVFISLKPYDGYVISDTVKSDITSGILAKQGGMLVTPVFVDPEYLYITMNVVTTYDPDATTLSSDEIASDITGNIQDYFSTNLSKYKQRFVFSKVQRLIDDTNDSIIGNIMTFNLQKRISFVFNYPTTIDVTYDIPLKAGSMTSNVFMYSTGDRYAVLSSFVDDGNGNVSVKDITTNAILTANVGTVDYTTGAVLVKDFIINGLAGSADDVRINFTPLNAITDIETTRNQIILLDDSTQDTTANIGSGMSVAVVTQ